MGYYAQGWSGDTGEIRIPKANTAQAFDIIGKSTNVFCRGATCHGHGYAELEEALTDQGFTVDVEDGDVVLIGFDNKYSGIEELLNELRHLVTEDSVFAFLGEDGAIWRWTPSGVEYATITWN
jgi:hypothetical protein